MGEPFMRRRRAMAAVVALALAAPGGRAAAEMPVIDTAAIAKFSEQITKLQRQIESLTAIQKSAQEQIDAVGRSGRITLPMIHIGKMAAQIASGARCLKPDFSKLMPRVDFRDVRVGSICDGAAMYGQTLFVRPEDLSGIKDWRTMAKWNAPASAATRCCGTRPQGRRRPISRSRNRPTKPAPPTSWPPPPATPPPPRPGCGRRRGLGCWRGPRPGAINCWRRNQVQAAMAAAADCRSRPTPGRLQGHQAASAAGGWAKPDAEGPKP